MKVEPFVLPFSQAKVDDLHSRLERTRWPDEVASGTWLYGADLAFLRDLCRYWRESFDWRRELDHMARFRHFRYASSDGWIHFIHERGRGPSPIPLVLTHGWPGSFLEMMKIIPLLTDPAAHGGDPSVSFDVVVPSLPGFGFSDRPSRPGMNTRRMAGIWAELMQALGYEHFAAQGGDFGAGVTTFLALEHAQRLLGIHLNYIPGSYQPFREPGGALRQEERDFLASAEQWDQVFGAYGHIQATEPQTVGYALNDSPAGLAAWIVEKFRDWADCGGDIERRFTKDELLANVTLYWMTETFTSSCRLYYEVGKEPVHFKKGQRVRVPCAIAHFPKEDPFPPRAWIERGYDIARWTEMPSGGHFAAAEEPELLAADIRAFFGGLRRR
jgi:pimeloyl-ACP methyl ester carboxylesterase